MPTIATAGKINTVRARASPKAQAIKIISDAGTLDATSGKVWENFRDMECPLAAIWIL
jgi:hypothetical protein